MIALEQDLAGEVALVLMTLLSWGEQNGGLAPVIDETVARFIAAGRPADPQITRALDHARRALSRYLAAGGRTPLWLPQFIVDLLNHQSETTH